jgi:hypothetical protein
MLLLIFASSLATAQGTKQYRSPNDVDLPPLEQRKIIGTWLTASISGSCTRSFENVNGKVYDVGRCSDGSGGNSGRLLTQTSPTKFLSRTSTSGDYYVILKNGDLSLHDKDGEIDVEPKHPGLWPNAQSKQPKAQQAEDAKTLRLTCFDVGYRYGHTATAAMKGNRVNPSWDFAIPDRCKNEPATRNGIHAGTRAAW